jgi:hypothetical protein
MRSPCCPSVYHLVSVLLSVYPLYFCYEDYQSALLSVYVCVRHSFLLGGLLDHIAVCVSYPIIVRQRIIASYYIISLFVRVCVSHLIISVSVWTASYQRNIGD